MKTTRQLWFVICLAAVGQLNVHAADAFYNVPVSSLKLTEGSLPVPGEQTNWRRMGMMEAIQPYAVLDGEGDIYLGGETYEPWRRSAEPSGQTVVIRAAEGKEVTGRLFMPKEDFSGMVQVRFKIPAKDAKPEAKAEFYTAKRDFYQGLQDRSIPGAAWFRYQATLAAHEATTNDDEMENMRWNRFGGRRVTELENTFSLFTGDRAVSENLQLDRALQSSTGETNNTETVALTNLIGITVQPMDWKALIKGTKPELDPLATCIPADQHALFFPSFAALTALIDEADADGTPILQALQPRGEDANARGRYQKQLCLQLTELSRLFGPQVVASAAFTGSDPFLRMGTDVGILFEAKSPQLVQANVLAQQAAARTANPDVKPVSGDIDGVPYTGAVSADRTISSYVAAVSNVVMVTNSRKQLETLIHTAQGKIAALSSQDEYLFFRNRYARSDVNETALLVLSDATIRRWCGPEWRIADSRRVRAAAVLADLQAAHMSELVAGKLTDKPLHTDYSVPDMDELHLTSAGARSSTYGGLNFMTPISELLITNVTDGEASAYEQWRDTYQRNWRAMFDPIAIRFSVSQKRVGVDLTVMPLIASSEYGTFIELSRGAQIFSDAGDPHTNELARLAFAVNAHSKPVAEAGNFVGNMAPGLRANFLGWLGQSITLYADDDPYWNELATATNADMFMENSYARLPLALCCEVKNSLGVAAFLTSLHAFADQSAPGMAVWQNLNYNGRPYVKISPAQLSRHADPGASWAVYYAVTPDSLTVTMSEALVKRALDRDAARTNSMQVNLAGTKPWLGSNICFQAESQLLSVLQKVSNDNGLSDQLLAWNNLPILNEWKRLYPDQDPVKLHEQFWGMKLVSPGGGNYVWNEQWHTMESSTFGCPAAPKTATVASPLDKIADMNLGLSFESQGLNAKGVMNRK